MCIFRIFKIRKFEFSINALRYTSLRMLCIACPYRPDTIISVRTTSVSRNQLAYWFTCSYKFILMTDIAVFAFSSFAITCVTGHLLQYTNVCAFSEIWAWIQLLPLSLEHFKVSQTSKDCKWNHISLTFAVFFCIVFYVDLFDSLTLVRNICEISGTAGHYVDLLAGLVAAGRGQTVGLAAAYFTLRAGICEKAMCS